MPLSCCDDAYDAMGLRKNNKRPRCIDEQNPGFAMASNGVSIGKTIIVPKGVE
jgi:hypothetical protein